MSRSISSDPTQGKAGGGGGILGSIFAGYVPLICHNHYPFIVYSVANYRPLISHFWTNVISAIPT